jgi:hypothetical protein
VLEKADDADKCEDAIRDLKAMGAKAKPACKAMVEASFSGKIPISAREICIKSIEAINPRLLKCILKGGAANNVAEHVASIDAFAELGEDGVGSVPFLIRLVKTQYAPRALRALAIVAPSDPDTHKAIRENALMRRDDVGSDELKWQLQLHALNALQVIAEKHPAQRKVAADIAARSLEIRNPSRLTSIEILEVCGSESKVALPALKKLLDDKQDFIREAASKAIRSIEK